MELIKFHTATFEPCETFCLQCSLMLSLIYGGPRVLGPGMKALFVHKLKAWFGKMGLKIPAYAKNYKGGRVSHLKKGSTPASFFIQERKPNGRGWAYNLGLLVLGPAVAPPLNPYR